MLKCVYIIPYSGNLVKGKNNSDGGSGSHIETGIEHLGTYFHVTPYVLERIKETPKEVNGRSNGSVGRSRDTNKLKGFFRDIRCLFRNHTAFFKHYRALRRTKPDFIYERSEYLNFNGILISKLLRIPHFYEANWVHYQGIAQFYDSYFNRAARWMEEKMYNAATHSFFIGNQNKHLSLTPGKWSVIQNGVSASVVKQFALRDNLVKGKTNICILANLMPHHRFDIFASALQSLGEDYHKKMALHLVGFHFEHVLNLIPTGIECTYHGAKDKKGVYEVLSRMNVAIISGGPQYSSFMKLYDYGAAKMAVICPDLENIVLNFTKQEIMFFKNEDPVSLADKITLLIDRPELIVSFGNALYEKVGSTFTWEKIFFGVMEKIASHTSKINAISAKHE